MYKNLYSTVKAPAKEGKYIDELVYVNCGIKRHAYVVGDNACDDKWSDRAA